MKTVVRYFIDNEITCRYSYTYFDTPIIPRKDDIIYNPENPYEAYSVKWVTYELEAQSMDSDYNLIDVYCSTDTRVIKEWTEHYDEVYDGDKIYEEVAND